MYLFRNSEQLSAKQKHPQWQLLLRTSRLSSPSSTGSLSSDSSPRPSRNANVSTRKPPLVSSSPPLPPNPLSLKPPSSLSVPVLPTRRASSFPSLSSPETGFFCPDGVVVLSRSARRNSISSRTPRFSPRSTSKQHYF
ncbi:chaperonin GroES [Cryptococcus gattii E566]|nr:chaperonin GroES [Cryptococcus gattii E566]